jgi:hypothetical protein
MASVNRAGAILTPTAALNLSGVGTTNDTDLVVGTFTEAAIDINVSAITGTTPTLDIYLDRKGADGVYYQIWHATQVTAVGAVSTSVGLGAPVNHSLGMIVRLRFALGGTTPAATLTRNVVGK